MNLQFCEWLAQLQILILTISLSTSGTSVLSKFSGEPYVSGWNGNYRTVMFNFVNVHVICMTFLYQSNYPYGRMPFVPMFLGFIVLRHQMVD